MKKVRMMDIANFVGVSKVTVSKVLSQTSGNNTKVNAKTAQKILDVARQLGYQPNIAAKQLAGQRGKLIGVLIDANSIFNEFPRIVYEEQAACARGYRIIVGQCHPDSEDVQKYFDDFLSRGVDGIIMHSHVYPGLSETMMEACSRFQHVVYYDKPSEVSDDINFVDIDLENGMRKLIKYIAGTGRKKISYFVPYMKPTLGKHQSYLRRENSFRAAMKELGLPFDEHFDERYLFPVEPGISEIAPLVKDLIEREQPDAIIARNDDVAAIVLKTFHELGIQCPGDIAVAGFDNRNFAEYLHPGLCTVDTNLALASCRAIEMLIRLIDGKDLSISERQISIKPEIVKRTSV